MPAAALNEALHGSIMALLSDCTDNNSSDGGGDLTCAVCRVLRNLTGVDEIRMYMVSDAGAVLVSLSHGATTTSNTAQIQTSSTPSPQPTLLLQVPRGRASAPSTHSTSPPRPRPARHGPSPCVGLPPSCPSASLMEPALLCPYYRDMTSPSHQGGSVTRVSAIGAEGVWRRLQSMGQSNTGSVDEAEGRGRGSNNRGGEGTAVSGMYRYEEKRGREGD
jgi:hypothetical protein